MKNHSFLLGVAAATLLLFLFLAMNRYDVVNIKPTLSIPVNLQKEHYFHVSADGFMAIDVFSKTDFTQYDLASREMKGFALQAPLAFNYRTEQALQHQVATVVGEKKVTSTSQVYLYSFYDLQQNKNIFDIVAVNKQAGKNYIGILAGTKHKKVNGEDRFLVIINFKNVYDNSTILKGWLFKKESLPPLISYESPDAIFEFSRSGLTELVDFDCSEDGKMTILAFQSSNWLFLADTKKWSQVPFKKEVGSIVFFTPEGALFTLVETFSEDDCVIWDPSTLKKVKGLTLRWSRSERIRFSRHGAYAAVWDGKDVIRIWSINSKSVVANLIVPSLSDRSIQREPVPRDYLIGDGPQAIDASPDLKTVIVYSWLANDIQYDEVNKKGTYSISHQIVDVFRISELMASGTDELALKLKR